MTWPAFLPTTVFCVLPGMFHTFVSMARLPPVAEEDVAPPEVSKAFNDLYRAVKDTSSTLFHLRTSRTDDNFLVDAGFEDRAADGKLTFEDIHTLCGRLSMMAVVASHAMLQQKLPDFVPAHTADPACLTALMPNDNHMRDITTWVLCEGRGPPLTQLDRDEFGLMCAADVCNTNIDAAFQADDAAYKADNAARLANLVFEKKQINAKLRDIQRERQNAGA